VDRFSHPRQSLVLSMRSPSQASSHLVTKRADNYSMSDLMPGGRLNVQCILCFIAHKATTSAWIYSLTNVFSYRNAGTGRSHEMPTIFFWLSTISQMLIQPYFIFDGQDRPWFPGGYERSYGTGPSLLVQRFQELLNAFGFSWHTVGVSYI